MPGCHVPLPFDPSQVSRALSSLCARLRYGAARSSAVELRAAPCWQLQGCATRPGLRHKMEVPWSQKPLPPEPEVWAPKLCLASSELCLLPVKCGGDAGYALLPPTHQGSQHRGASSMAELGARCPAVLTKASPCIPQTSSPGVTNVLSWMTLKKIQTHSILQSIGGRRPHKWHLGAKTMLLSRCTALVFTLCNPVITGILITPPDTICISFIRQIRKRD